MENNKVTPLIETVELKKLFKLNGGARLHAVDGINLKIYPGENFTIERVLVPDSLYLGQDSYQATLLSCPNEESSNLGLIPLKVLKQNAADAFRDGE